jgi:glycosyltransferase involved in cell wall biosynthesis
MRGFSFINAASADYRVHVLVVPVAGPAILDAAAADGPVPATTRCLPLPVGGRAAALVPALLATPAWRQRISRSYPLPPPAAAAPATLAAAAVQAIRPEPGTPVHVARSYLAPLGIALAERLGSRWATLDLDDDDEALARSAGDDDTAAGYGRLVSVFGPLFDGVALAAAAEATAIRDRHGLSVTVLPNAVDRQAADGQAPGIEAAAVAGAARAQRVSLLFVGNLTYWPNADAAIRLVRDVLPRLRQLTSRPVTITLAGETGGSPQLAALARVPGVEVAGFVPDLSASYAGADLVVTPLAFAAGTRIKLLEAFSHGVPVVTTTPGAAGLGVVSGEHALIADTAGEMAGAIARLASDRVLAARLAAGGTELVRQHYSRAVVQPQIRAFFEQAAGRRVGSRLTSGPSLADRPGNRAGPPV